MKKLRILADDKIPFLKGVLDEVADVIYKPGPEISRADAMKADALIIRTRTHCDRSLLEGTPVKYIASATIGFDHIDTAYCRVNGIEWTNAPGCNAGSVEQYIVSVLLNYGQRRNTDLRGKVLGIVGVGNVGSRVARAAEALGMDVLLNDPPRARREGEAGFVSLPAIMEKADIITLHVPLNRSGIDRTFHLAGEEFFSRLGRDVYLINSSRGEVVDGEALDRALQSGRLEGACLDVWENEPEIPVGLMNRTDIVSPHIAGYSVDGKAGGTTMSIRALSRRFSLGFDHWTPEHLPAPENPSLVIDCTDMTERDILREVYLSTYDVREDDARLRENPGRFEYFRGHYPLRREPPAFSVKLINNPFEDLNHVLQQLRFSVLETACFC